MPGWFAALDEGQRRVVLVLAAVVVSLGLAIGVVALTDGDPSQATVQTDDQVTSSTTASSTSTTTPTSSTSRTSTTAKTSSTSTTKAKGKATGGGGTTTTKGTKGTTATTATTRPTTTQATAPPSGGGGPCAGGGGAAGQMATLFCNHRAKLGLPSMSRNSALDAMAQEWAAKMAAEGTLSHRPNSEARTMVAARCDCPGWAENVAFDDSAQEAFSAWLASSSGHREHIEDPRDGEHGIGVASGGGYLWFVQVFGYYQ
jgi:uncharacterized protein YkwD